MNIAFNNIAKSGSLNFNRVKLHLFKVFLWGEGGLLCEIIDLFWEMAGKVDGAENYIKRIEVLHKKCI